MSYFAKMFGYGKKQELDEINRLELLKEKEKTIQKDAEIDRLLNLLSQRNERIIQRNNEIIQRMTCGLDDFVRFYDSK